MQLDRLIHPKHFVTVTSDRGSINSFRTVHIMHLDENTCLFYNSVKAFTMSCHELPHLSNIMARRHIDFLQTLSPDNTLCLKFLETG